MEDFIIAALVLVLFAVFLFKRQSFADALAPGPCTPTPAPAGRTCYKRSDGVTPTFPDSIACSVTNSAHPNAVSAGCGKHYCCQ